MAEHTDNKPFPSFSKLLFTLPSSDPNYIPTQSFRSYAENGHVLDADIISRHLSDDLKRASWLESFIAPYLADLADARQRIGYQKCLLSPIRRVPLDILQSIFLACLPQRFVEANPNAAPLLLCQVCRYWRDIALALPVLWASFKVRRPARGLCSPALPLAELWLERSHLAPLSICLPVDTDQGCNPASDDVHLLIRLFLKHLSRWKAMHMCLRDLIYYQHHIPYYKVSTVLEEIELCFSLDSYGSEGLYDLGFRALRDLVPRIWTSSSRLQSLTLNATSTNNVLDILRTCPDIRDCEFHITNDSVHVGPDNRLTLPLLYKLNIRARNTFFNLLHAITTPSLRILIIKGEKRWSQTSFQDFIDRFSCSIQEFSMINITMGPDELLRTLEHIGTTVKTLRIHSYPQGRAERPISDVILRGITSHLLVPNLEVLDLGCDSMEPKHHQLLVEMVASRLDDRVISRLGLGSGTASSNLRSGQTLRKICLSPDRDTAHMHTESLAFVEALGREGVEVSDDSGWRACRIDGWFHGIRAWPGSNRW